MQIERKKISEMNRAEYNPRIELAPGDREYEKLRENIKKYGLVIPIIWNKRTNNIVGGHQRLTVLENEGETEVDVSVVDLDDAEEKQLNIALNKLGGEWDEEKLTALLSELGDDASLTGFSEEETARLTNDIESMLDNKTVEDELSDYKEVYNLSLNFDRDDKDELEEYVKANGKDELIEIIIQRAKGEI